MNASPTRDDWMPPQERGWGRSLLLALLAHAVLFAGLAWVTRWTTQAVVSAEAELWASVPVQAAPPEASPAPPPPPEPAPAPPVREQPPPPPAPSPDADIAVQKQKAQQEKARKEQERKAREQAEKAKREKAEAEKAKREKAEAAKREKAEREKAEREKARKEQERKEQARKDAQRREEVQRKLEAAEADNRRKEEIRRIQGMAGGTGGPQSSGSAAKSAGPSPSYAGRIAARIKPNITYLGSGNPRAEVEIRVSPDGTIQSAKLLKKSGQADWDEAVLKAIEKTEKLPLDTDGRIPPVIIMDLRPRD